MQKRKLKDIEEVRGLTDGVMTLRRQIMIGMICLGKDKGSYFHMTRGKEINTEWLV